jgi:hypothetical protein
MKNTEGNGSDLGLFLYTAGILEETTKPLFQDGQAPWSRFVIVFTRVQRSSANITDYCILS